MDETIPEDYQFFMFAPMLGTEPFRRQVGRRSAEEKSPQDKVLSPFHAFMRKDFVSPTFHHFLHTLRHNLGEARQNDIEPRVNSSVGLPVFGAHLYYNIQW